MYKSLLFFSEFIASVGTTRRIFNRTRFYWFVIKDSFDNNIK